MATAVDLCNRALLRIGHSSAIEALDEDSAEAAVCARFFEAQRDEMLEAFAWPFATRRVVLSALSGVTRTDWAYVFAVPTDCLSPRYVVPQGVRNPTAAQRVAFQVEANDAGDGQVLLCDESAPEFVYTVRLEDPTRWPAGFSSALEFALASQLALALKKDQRLAVGLMQRAEELAQRAAARAMNQLQRDAEPDVDFISARG